MRKKPRVCVDVPLHWKPPVKARMPGEGYPFWKMVKVPPGSRVRLYSLCAELLTYHCHYVSGTYVPCVLADGGACPYHATNGPRLIYQGSLAVWNDSEKEIQIVHLTKAAIRDHPGLDERKDLAGLPVTVGRKNGGLNARQYVLLGDKPAFPVPPEKQIEPTELYKTLLNIWGVELVYKEERKTECREF